MANLNFILQTLKQQKCVLFLGPEALTLPNQRSLHAELCNYLDVNNNQNIQRYYDKDEFFFFADDVAKMMTCYQINEFYCRSFHTELYQKIAQLPFNLIVSVNPDLLLHHTFSDLGIEHQFAYHGNPENNAIVEPKRDNPLIYNLFGSIEKAESMILTHDDLFEFIFNIMNQKALPQEIRSTLNNADNFIFLGFRFDKWYLQIILKMLNPKRKKYQLALDDKLLSDKRTFFLDQFRLDFEDITTEKFVDTLLEKCQTEGILRHLSKTQRSISQEITDLVANSDLDKALEKAVAFLKDKNDEDLLNDFINTQSTHNRLKRQITKGIISNADMQLETNKIQNAILELLKELKMFEQ